VSFAVRRPSITIETNGRFSRRRKIKKVGGNKHTERKGERVQVKYDQEGKETEKVKRHTEIYLER
jgi:hypothetical protein